MEKVEKDGKVAVLYTPGFGAGWSTWNKDVGEALCMDARIVSAFIEGGVNVARTKAKELFPGIYAEADELAIKWVDRGMQFEIEEYDGSETVHVIGNRAYYTA